LAFSHVLSASLHHATRVAMARAATEHLEQPQLTELLNMSSSQLDETSGHATERAGRDEAWREEIMHIPVNQIARFQIPGQQDGASRGELHHFRDMHDNDVAKCFHAWAWTEAQKDMLMIMLKRGLQGMQMHQQMAASMAINSELLWIWMHLGPPLTEKLLSKILLWGCEKFELLYNIKVFHNDFHNRIASQIILQKVEPRIGEIVANHMQDFAATASPEEMAMAAEETTDEEERIESEVLENDSGSDKGDE
jgi:hypothetical protein